MSKTDAAPTYGWVFLSAFHRRMSKAFIAIIILLVIVAYTIFHRLEADCTDTVERHDKVGKFEIDFKVSRVCDEVTSFTTQ